MFFLVVVGFIATIAFYRRAKVVGVHPGKAASVPFVGMGMMLAVTLSFALCLGGFLQLMGASKGLVGWIGFTMDCFFVLMYLAFIKRNWDVLAASKESVNSGGG